MTTTAKGEELTTLEIVDTSNFPNNIFICNAAFDNFHKICRFCLSFDDVKPFLDMTYKQASVQTIISDSLSLKVEPNDRLPYNLCVVCISELIRCYEFKRRCIQATDILQNSRIDRGSVSVKWEETTQSNNARGFDTFQDNFLNNDEETLPNICNNDILDDTDRNNVIIKTEEIGDEPSTSNGGVSEYIVNRQDLINKNEEILNDISECIGGPDMIIKDEPIVCDDNITEIQSCNFIIKSEENIIIGNTTLSDDYILGNVNNDNLSNNEAENKNRNCSFEYKTAELTTSKLPIQDYEENYCICEICKNRFSNDEVTQYSKEKSQICKVCLETLTVRKSISYKTHRIKPTGTSRTNIHSNKQPHMCIICKKSFAQKSYLNLHLRIHTGNGMYKCTICKMSFILQSSLNMHVLIHTGAKPYACNICMKSFNQRTNLNTHMRTHMRMHKCSYCKKSFTDITRLNVHMQIHTGERAHKCSVCTKSFFQKSDLKNHMLIHMNDRQHECGVCKKSFIRKSGLTNHMLIHTSEKLHECSVCMKSFSQKCNLKTHMLIHNGERQHNCAVCRRSFVRKSDLKKHMLIHTSEKPYKCNVCHRSFTQKGSVTAHMVIHTGERPYKCTVCKKSFGYKYSLTKHKLIHVDEKLI